jgi:PBSX family phage terminase large subunit
MALNPGQIAIAQSPARFRVAICGRRFGKTHLAIRELCKAARIPEREVWFVSPTYRQSKQIVWRKLKNKLSDLGWISKANESELAIELKNGSRICLKGADNHDSLRGVGLDFLVLDEFADIDSEAWFETLRPTLSDKRGSAMFIGTPRGKNNWSYDLFQMQQEDPSNWASFQFTTLDGGNVDAEEIAQARRDLDIRTFRQEYEATFETAGNRVYYAFEREHNVRAWTDPVPTSIAVGCDFNVSPMCAAIFVRKGDDVWAIDEIQMYSSNTQELVDEIRSRYPQVKPDRVFAYPDPAGSARSTKSGGLTDHIILRNAGFQVKAPRAHHPVRDGINAVNSMLCSAENTRRFFVDPKCKNIIECLEKFGYKPDTQVPDKDSGYDHMADAVRYYFDYVFPVRRDIEYQAPQRWGHGIGSHNAPGVKQQKTIRI